MSASFFCPDCVMRFLLPALEGETAEQILERAAVTRDAQCPKCGRVCSCCTKSVEAGTASSVQGFPPGASTVDGSMRDVLEVRYKPLMCEVCVLGSKCEACGLDMSWMRF